ncbi:Asparagine synthetase domain-containing protein 1, partial [Hondaea fermentalgiana]
KLTAALRDAVRLRVEFHREGALGVLFSGGLDCTVLAALAHEFLPQGEPIDLFSVCFQAPQHQSPDRRSAVESWRELRQAFPDRQWNLVCTNRCDSDILREERHILSLLEPRTTHMDFNIGAALWFAAQGSRCRGGTHLKASCVHKACVTCCKMHQRAKPDAERCGSHKLSQDKDAARKRRRQLEFQDAGASLTSAGSQQRATLSKGENEAAQQEYTSPARILLSGLGADEQLGGYGRHRVSYTKGGWENLRSELETDTARLWTRNLGRDDRCISDRGKEVRHPYLDENVMETLASLPLEHVVDPRLPSGDGDKRLLRIVACQLGLPGVSGLAKRAIQFGTRIAQVSRAHAPGSNRSYDASAAYVIRSESV